MLYPIENKYRNLKNLDGYWLFSADKENVGLNSDWQSEIAGDVRELGVPASWNEQANDLYNFHGKGWYQKDIFVSEDWVNKSVYLRFGSVAGKAYVYVNGEFAFSHIGTALPFESDISSLVKFGENNRIIVIADSTLDPWGLPPAALENSEGSAGFTYSYPAVPYDFFPYGGIQRSVWLYSTSKNRIEDIVIKTDVKNNVAVVNYRITFTTVFSGMISINGDKFLVDNSNVFEGSFEIENPRLWDIGKPELYELKVLTDFDSYTQSYGIRTIRVENNQFLLNDKPVFFKGFGKHEDFYVLGKGFNHALWAKDFYLLDWIGANSFRTSHYPYDENILDYADRHGVLVIDETPFVGLSDRCYNQEMLDKALPVVEELYNRDKNHPSVVMWSLANEPQNTDYENEWFFKELSNKIRTLDSTRPITYVASLKPEKCVGLKYFDVVCINKYCGWYDGTGRVYETDNMFEQFVDEYYNLYKKPIIMTEFGADAISGMHSDPPLMFTEEYQRDMVVRQYNLLKKRPYVIGAHIWAFADFRTAQTISRIVNNHKGVFTRDRQPKLLAHVLKDLWKK